MSTSIQVKSILMADDDSDDQFFFQKAVQEISKDIKLEIVVDGEKLMNYLLANTSNLPEVVFIDLNMPRKNGMECLTEIKSNDLLKHLIVIMHSTSLREETANELYGLDAHYYMHKSDYNLLAKNIAQLIDILYHDSARPPKSKFILSAKKVRN